MKTKKLIIILASILVIPVTFLVILAGLLVYCKVTDTVIFDIVGVTYNYDGELSAEEIRSISGITFPSDILFVGRSHGESKNSNSWYYTSKEPFKLPENAKERRVEVTLENQTYELSLGGFASGITWRSDKPFKTPVDLDDLYKNGDLCFKDKESLVLAVEELEAKGKKWKTDSTLERDERIFSLLFKTNVIGATKSWWRDWITNNFVFEAQVLETPEKYYLYLNSREAYPSELEALKAKEVAVE